VRTLLTGCRPPEVPLLHSRIKATGYEVVKGEIDLELIMC
jgi:hypothetical protein